ncbi:MAG TPA: DUF2203 family protein [Fimbriiglobus sp.]|jgi:hypothetical protein
MNSSSNRASNSAGKSRKKDVSLDLHTARQMIPLVRSIVTDIVGTRRRLGTISPEQESLDRNRRSLDWSNRQRRYRLQEEMTQAESELKKAETELYSLGLSLVDAEGGRVDFPTKINGRQAAFSWQLGEEALEFWHYSGELTRRPIPTDWIKGAPIRQRREI